MSAFDSARDLMIDAQFATFGESGIPFVPASGAGPATIRTILRRPTEEQALEQGRIVKARPFVRIPFADAPNLVQGDAFDQNGRRWKLAAAPTRERDGKVWKADVVDAGPPA